MTVLVVYESMYGSTRAIAEAIGQGLEGSTPVEVVEVGALAASDRGVRIPDGVTLLVVGGPTHAFGMSREQTRQDAAKDAPEGIVSGGAGLRDWLDRLELPAGMPVATFDTKVLTPNLPGSAAKAAERHLRRLGAHPVAKARTFRVHGRSDGLVAGEVEAARTWGRELAATAARTR